MKNGIHLRLPLSNLGGGRSKVERLVTKYSERNEDQRVTIWVESQRRAARGDEARVGEMAGMRAAKYLFQRAESVGIKALQSIGGIEYGSAEVGRHGGVTRQHREAVCRGGGLHCHRCGAIESERQSYTEKTERVEVERQQAAAEAERAEAQRRRKR